MFAVLLPEFDLYRAVITGYGCRYHISCGHDKTSDGMVLRTHKESHASHMAPCTMLRVFKPRSSVTLDPLEIRFCATEAFQFLNI